MHMVKFTAIIQKEDDSYVAKCAQTGTISQGKTVDDAVANLKEATELYLEEFPDLKMPILTTFDIAGDTNA